MFKKKVYCSPFTLSSWEKRIFPAIYSIFHTMLIQKVLTQKIWTKSNIRTEITTELSSSFTFPSMTLETVFEDKNSATVGAGQGSCASGKTNGAAFSSARGSLSYWRQPRGWETWEHHSNNKNCHRSISLFLYFF